MPESFQKLVKKYGVKMGAKKWREYKKKHPKKVKVVKKKRSRARRKKK